MQDARLSNNKQDDILSCNNTALTLHMDESDSRSLQHSVSKQVLS